MKTIRRPMFHRFAALALGLSAVVAEFKVKPVSPEQAAGYKLVPTFFKRAALVQGILVATSANVPDVVHLAAAYQYDRVMRGIEPEVAQQVRDQKVPCVLVGHRELTSDMPPFVSDKKREKLDVYDWRPAPPPDSPRQSRCQAGLPPHRQKQPAGDWGAEGFFVVAWHQPKIWLR